MNRLVWERKTVEKMVALYCRDHHGKNHHGGSGDRNHDLHGNQSYPSGVQLCASCRELLDYATVRIDKCRYGVEKPTCSACTTHCYKPDYRERIRSVMRYAGPRMLFHHPFTALVYLWFKRTQPRAINR